MSNSIVGIEKADMVFIFGYNPADSHPIVANRVIKAKRNGAKIIVCDPRKIETARIADAFVETRLAAGWRSTYGMLDSRFDSAYIVDLLYPAA